MRSNVVLDEMSYLAMQNLPKRMSASKLMRTFLVAATTNDKEWNRYLKSSEEAREVRDYLCEKLSGRFD